MKENNKKYNAIDFANYHSGAMPPDEMNALEKAALEDPFLADALEGYAFSKDPGKEMDEIRMRLDQKRKQQKVFSIASLSSGNWWKIAAIFILFLGTGYFFFTKNSTKESSLAVNENQARKGNPVIAPPVKNDTAAIEDNLAFGKTSTNKNKNNTDKLSKPTANPIQMSPVEKAAPGEARIREEKSRSEKQGADETGKIIAMNNHKAIRSHITRKDSEEQSFFRSSDTTALVAASSARYKRDTDNTVAMNKTNSTLNEVVVTGYGTEKRKSITGSVSDKLEGKVSGVNVTTDTPYLKEGKENFDQYIKNNAVSVYDSTGERMTANILLSFTLNKKGKPTNIKVLESSCETCEKQAIRLLEDGPKWIGKRGDPGTVRIQF